MAVRQNRAGRGARTRKKSPGRLSGKYLFWLLFFFLMACLFLVNLKAIRRSVEETGFLDRLFRREREDRSWLTDPALPPKNAPSGQEAPETDTATPAPPPSPAPAVPAPAAGEPAPRDARPGAVPPGPAAPAVQTPAAPAAPRRQPRTAPERPAAVPPAAAPPAAAPSGQTAPAAVPRQGTGQADSRAERAIYLMRVERDGSITRNRVIRLIPVSDSPLLDALRALVSGPAETETRAGLRSMIPQGTRVLGAEMRNGTAWINFSEEFLFNPYGVEGWAAQLRQVVWTATEFPTVRDVQVLIDGRQIDYLGEGIWIGSPVSRGSF